MGTGRWRHEALVQARGHCRGKAAYEYGGNTRWFDDSRVSRWIVNACCWRHLLLPSLQLIFTSGACMLHVPPALMLMAPAAARVSAPARVMATPEGVIVTDVPPMVICIRVAAIIWICIASTTQPTGENPRHGHADARPGSKIQTVDERQLHLQPTDRQRVEHVDYPSHRHAVVLFEPFVG